MNCKICDHTPVPFGDGRVLDKHLVRYFRCQQCGFIQTEEPYWLEEAYSDAITKTDVGLVGRNVSLAELAKLLILAFFDHQAKFVDYGGGYGMFVRLMRDAGLDFYLYDTYCENLFAKGLAIERAGDAPFELVTAFEVFEHLVHPLDEIERMRAFSPSIFLTTTLVPSPPPPVGEWWYYGLEHGQHVALYSYQTLKFIAERFGVQLLSNGQNLHLLTPKTIASWKFHVLLNRWGRLLTKRWISRKLAGRSLLAADYEKLAGRPLR